MAMSCARSPVASIATDSVSRLPPPRFGYGCDAAEPAGRGAPEAVEVYEIGERLPLAAAESVKRGSIAHMPGVLIPRTLGVTPMDRTGKHAHRGVVSRGQRGLPS